MAKFSFEQGIAASDDFSSWSRDEIENLQEAILEKERSTFSEKWFYTHLKKEHPKLPRVDMLNVFCSFLGYGSWQEFKKSISLEVNDANTVKRSVGSKLRLVGVLVLVLLLGSGLYALVPGTNRHEFCFIDYWQRTPIENEFRIEVNGESGAFLKPDSNACVLVESSRDTIELVVHAKYYKRDTITRILTGEVPREVSVKTNDYALMIHYFSKGLVNDWKKRRSQLKEMFHQDAKIYRHFEGTEGVELYSSKEFIAKMTLPVPQLENIEVLETLYQGDKIIELRFIQLQER